MIFLRLFWEFFKIGLFSVGGGLATLPFLYELQANTGWFTVEDIGNMIAVSESTPGPMGINMATYTGFTIAGIPGGIVAVIGEVTPCVIIILLITRIMKKFKDNKYVQFAMYGLRAASVGLIVVACLQVAKAAFLDTELYSATGSLTDLFSIPAIIFAVVLAVVYVKTNKHPIIYIAAAAVIGILLKM
ncbi:MAG: chromate transporter [Lachnospiraceae bacterium]|nr:chromate transporter [Lachnospiraceae bacterium]